MPCLALYQPDIPQNVGSAIRLAACMGVALHIIEPCGFPLDDRRIRRVSMDYFDRAALTRHTSWQAFCGWRDTQAPAPRLVLLSTKASVPYTAFAFAPDDIVLLGQESGGVPDEVLLAADARLRIPMQPGTRSLNVTLAAAMVLGEGLRQAGLGIRDWEKYGA